MMRALHTTYRGRSIVLECTHKKVFPPPQTYGSTAADIDVLWKQGNISATQHQMLTTWRDNCGLMVMGPRCLDCPLALKQNPRPGRPNVYETEQWLPAKKRIYWEDMKLGKLAASEDFEPEEPEPEEPEPPEPEELEEPEPPDPEELEEPVTPLEEFPTPEEIPTLEEIPTSDEPANEKTPSIISEAEENAFADLAQDDDIIDALSKE